MVDNFLSLLLAIKVQKISWHFGRYIDSLESCDLLFKLIFWDSFATFLSFIYTCRQLSYRCWTCGGEAMTDVPRCGLQENVVRYRRQTADLVDSVDAGEAFRTGIY